MAINMKGKLSPKTLITGASGKLGKELQKVYPSALTPSHQEIDLTSPEAIHNYLSNHTPDIAIHAGALTGIRECEENKELAWKTNVIATKDLVETCLTFNSECYFIYISTACVFYGDRGNYSEDDIPYPKNFYSITKLLGEFMVKLLCNRDRWLIIRTNFVPREKWPYPKAFVDRWGTYLFADDLALAIKQVIAQKLKGIVHICGEDKLSVYELAKITTPNIQPMSLAEYSGPPLTQNMTLVSKRIPPFKLRREI